MHEDQSPLFFPIKAAALKVGVSYRILLEAVNDGSIPCHRLGKSRRLLKIEEILKAIKTLPAKKENNHD